jgi:hypothetical protein
VKFAFLLLLLLLLSHIQGWPKTYFYDPLVKVDKDDGILWFGIDTVNSSNSKPGKWEQQGVGVEGTYARDRHTHIEPAALETVFRSVGVVGFGRGGGVYGLLLL